MMVTEGENIQLNSLYFTFPGILSATWKMTKEPEKSSEKARGLCHLETGDRRTCGSKPRGTAFWSRVICPEEALLFLLLVAVSSIPPCKDINKQSCPSWIARELQALYSSEQRQTQKWRQGYQAFLLLLVNLWAQVRSQYFSAKAV
jgi:hypothetical protein